VARYLFKLMAYKDEYEVARLHTSAGFMDKIKSEFEGDYQISYHLAPPLLARHNQDGKPIKQKFGSWMHTAFKLLAPLKVLRATIFDPFSYSTERKQERALIQDYCNTIANVLLLLNASNHAKVLTFAKLPENIRGFGHVKAQHLAKVWPQWVALQKELR
jgi:indolepyruvate ferredoxin oxidoreductase